MNIPKLGILLCGHGSRKPAATEHFNALARQFRQHYTAWEVEHGYLEFAKPVYQEAVEKLYQRGVRQIVALPIMLFAASHVKNDIPHELNSLADKYPDLNIKMSSQVGVSPQLLNLCKHLIEQTIQQHNVPTIEDCALLVVGRGTTDSDANSEVEKLNRMLVEGLGFGLGMTAYSGTAKPSVPEALGWLSKLPFKQTIALPLFFFTGILLDRVQAQVAQYNVEQTAATQAQPCHLTPALGADPLLMQLWDERIEQALKKTANMNCQLCKYRVQIVGYEHQQGQKQVGHHYHAKADHAKADHGHQH